MDHPIEDALRKQSEWLRTTLSSIGDAVISTDADANVTFMNRVAEELTGWSQAEAIGKPLVDVFRIVHERTREPALNPALRALAEGRIVGLANHTVLLRRDGSETPIDDSAAPMHDESGRAIGAVLVFRDVSERKRAEFDNARLAAIVESSSDAIVSKSLEGVIQTWNGAAERLFGYSAAEAIGQPIAMIIPPERMEEERAILECIRRGERVEPFETVRITKGGRPLDVSLSISPICDSEGNVIGASKIARDITDRVAGEKAVADYLARLDYAVRLSGVGFWYCDLPFDELNWDVRVKEHFWMSPDARVAIGDFYDRIHPDDRESTRKAIDASIAQRTQYDVDYRTVDPATGAIKWIRALGGTAYNPDGAPRRFDGVTVDITDRKLDELRLATLLEGEREQGRLLKQIADAALTIHSSGSLDSVLHVISEEARRILNARQSVSSLTISADGAQTVNAASFAKDFDPQGAYDLGVSLQNVYAELCQTNRSARLNDAELQRLCNASETENGRRLPQGWMAAPFVSRGGRNLGLIQLFDKATGAFGENDETVLAQLAHIASVAIENARLNGELRDQDRRKDEFLALLAHELRNPLAPLRNGLQVIRLAAHDVSATAQARAMMERQLTHMVRLIDDLLDVSRISRNKMELRRSRVLIADIVNSAVETARPMIEEAGHELTVSLPTEPLALNADLTRLSQVFGNLLTNSAKYTPSGGQIWLTVEIQGSDAVATIRDTGIGIPASALPTIFDMFSQVDRSFERAAGGLGIGLALVRGLVEMHGGTVVATSPGQGLGSTFTVRIPTFELRPEPKPASSADPLAPLKTHSRRILVVDDNRDSAASMAMMFRLLGDDVQVAHDGVDAFERSALFRPELILMDVGMPRMNGYEATRRIRNEAWGKGMIIIALTGWGQETDRLQSREAGCNAHLVKPVHLPELQTLLATLMPRGESDGPPD